MTNSKLQINSKTQNSNKFLKYILPNRGTWGEVLFWISLTAIVVIATVILYG